MAKKQTEEHRKFLIESRGFPAGYHSKQEYENALAQSALIEKQCLTCGKVFQGPMKVECCSPECVEKKRRERTVQTNIERYGGVAPLSSQEVKRRAVQTNIERYGCENPQQNKEIKQKTRQTCIERYGNYCHLNSVDYSEKRKIALLERYRSG